MCDVPCLNMVVTSTLKVCGKKRFAKGAQERVHSITC
jgi:hypothetical protein